MTQTLATLAPETTAAPKRVTILGATGTIGQNTIDLLQQHAEQYEVEALTARSNVKRLAEQAKTLQPNFVAIEDESKFSELKELLVDTDIEVAAGARAVEEAASRPSDWVMSGIVGAAALAPTLAAIRRGATVALANKECLVCAGDLVTAEVKKHNATLLPVDSEHNAIFQAFDFEQPDKVEKITLTASGGPFRTFSKEQMALITPEQAVKHPNWTMGAKISVDSATMMNKGLEIIEAYHLFPVEKSQIEVLVHPESIVHCLVSYVDGGILAGLSAPDMRVPIAFALGWPERIEKQTALLNLAEIGKLTFEAPNEDQFPALRLAREALIQGDAAPTVLNAANEVAVESFLTEKIAFLDIAVIVEQTLEAIGNATPTSLEDILAADSEARRIAHQLITEYQ